MTLRERRALALLVGSLLLFVVSTSATLVMWPTGAEGASARSSDLWLFTIVLLFAAVVCSWMWFEHVREEARRRR